MGAEIKLNHCEETMKQQINDSWRDFGDDEGDDEETVSLCDFVVSSDSNEFWNHDDDFNKQDHHHHHHHHHHHDHQDFFEFFSQDFHAPGSSSYPENNSIIFCGKLISSRGKQPNVEDKSQGLKCKVKHENEKKKCLFPWKMSHSFNKSRISSSSSTSSSAAAAAAAAKESKGKSFNKSLSLPAPRSKNNSGKFIGTESKKLDGEKFDFSVKKVSVSATPVKSRWYLFAFGVGRFPVEIELKDMKMRQSRQSKAMKFQAPPNVGGEPENVKHYKGRKRSAKGLWRLLKGFGVEKYT